ncbi:hypothetical protein DIPPA_19610 [Diplonema papillatum]|nr:hypothetical protein DIPPA_19610 [Diplonema papillatum]
MLLSARVDALADKKGGDHHVPRVGVRQRDVHTLLEPAQHGAKSHGRFVAARTSSVVAVAGGGPPPLSPRRFFRANCPLFPSENSGCAAGVPTPSSWTRNSLVTLRATSLSPRPKMASISSRKMSASARRARRGRAL